MYGENLPELPASEALHETWQDLNYARDGFAGALPFEWRELQAYTELAGADLLPCEAQCLMDMSRAYCMSIADKNPLSIAPLERNV